MFLRACTCFSIDTHTPKRTSLGINKEEALGVRAKRVESSNKTSIVQDKHKTLVAAFPFQALAMKTSQRSKLPRLKLRDDPAKHKPNATLFLHSNSINPEQLLFLFSK